MRILITGGTGFIGSHLAESLLSEGGNEIYATYWSGQGNENVKHLEGKIKLLKLDVKDSAEIERLLMEIKPDEIYHLAAQSFPTVSWKKPWYTMETNVKSTVNIFETIKKNNLKTKVLVACSSAEYGFVKKGEVPLKENHSLLPLHPYGVSKVAQDLLTYQYFKNFDIHAIRARIFNTTGPRKVGDVFADFAGQIAKMEAGLQKPIISVGNLEAQRDVTDVRDGVRALMMLLRKGAAGEVYNICTSRTVKI